MASRRNSSTPPPAESMANLAQTYETLLLGMERQRENAREMARRARQMYDQALKMREQNQRTPLP